MAVNFAAVLAQRKQRSVLIDLDWVGNDVAMQLGAAPQYTLMEVAENLDRMDQALFESLVTRDPLGLMMVGPPDALEQRGHFSEHMFREFATFLVEKYDSVVIDGGRAVSDEMVLAAGQVSAAVFLVVTQEFPAIRNAQRYIGFLMRMGFTQDQIRVVVNQYTRKVNSHYASLEQIQQTLNQPVFYGIPSSPAVIASINRARPFVANREAAGDLDRVFRAFVDKATGAAKKPAAQANWLRNPPPASRGTVISYMGSRPLVRPGSGADRWFELKSQVHHKLLNSLTADQFKDLNKDSARAQVGAVVEKLILDEGLPMTLAERERLIEEILDEVFGLGPLEPLLKDPTISDIMVNGFDNVYMERGGRLVETNIRFKDQAHVRMIIDRIVSAVGRRIDDSSPIVDARLVDGSRVCAVIPPLSLIGPVISIRRYGKKVLTTEELLKHETFTTGMLDFLSGCVEARLNMVISGGSGSGKTTMLNTLSRFIPEEERIVTIEDTAELQMQQNHVVRLETRPANIEGAGAITQRDLVINALRMRPDRIVVGESRGPEALDMLQAMNTGHEAR